MNLIYVIVSGVCLFFLLTQNFISITLGYTVSRDIFKDKIGNSLGIEASEVIDEKGVKLNLNLKLSSKLCFETAFKNDTYPFVKENIIDKNLEDIAATIREPLLKIDKIATTKAVTAKVASSIYSDILSITPSANAQDVANDAGITTDYMLTVSEAFFNKIVEKDTDFSNCMQNMYTSFETMYDMLETKNAAYAVLTVDSTKRSELSDQIAEPLKTLGWVDSGKTLLTEDDSLCTLLDKLLGLNSSGDSGSNGGSEPLLAPSLTAEENNSSKFADLIKDLVYSKIDTAGNIVGWVFRIIGFVHIFVVAAWGILALFCVIKCLFKNPGIFFGLIFWLNFIIQLFLGIIFVFVVPLLRNVVGIIPVVGKNIATFIQPFGLSIASSTTITAFCAVGVFITSFIYRHWKRKRKDEI